MADVEVELRKLATLVLFLKNGPRLLRTVTKKILATRMREARNVVKEDKLSGQLLNAPSGRLRTSIGSAVEEDRNGAVIGRLGILTPGAETLVYGRAHEFGTKGPIRPRPPRVLLTIPLDAAKTPAGKLRFTAREAAGLFDETRWLPAKPGGKAKAILYGWKGDRMIPLFAGVEEVPPIPAKHFLGDTIKQFEPIIRNDLVGAWSDLVKERS